jgi:hydrogenase-1 operon protein HyaF
MQPFPIPVRAAPIIGPGSQPPDEVDLAVLAMPQGMNTFEMPRVPERADPAVLAAVRELLAGLLRQLDAWDPTGADAPPVIDLAGVPPAVLAVANELLGEGEVSVKVAGEPELRIQESVFAGLWRCCAFDAQGVLRHDWVEAGTVPRAVLQAAVAGAEAAPADLPLPAGAMNSPALVAELKASLADVVPGRCAKQINLTLLPMSPDDHALLEQLLPVGPVAIMSRGFGNCRVTSTRVRNVWRVQYFNSMQTLILNTIEVVDVPEVAIASADDLADSRERLAELVRWLGEA